jgi:hypothetical protein
MRLLEIDAVELSADECNTIWGGGEAARLVGLGIASGVLAGYLGLAGMAYAYYNYFKD